MFVLYVFDSLLIGCINIFCRMSCLSRFIAVENIIPTNLVKIIIIIRCIVIVEILSNYAVAKPPFRNWSFRKRIKTARISTVTEKIWGIIMDVLQTLAEAFSFDQDEMMRASINNCNNELGAVRRTIMALRSVAWFTCET